MTAGHITMHTVVNQRDLYIHIFQKTLSEIAWPKGTMVALFNIKNRLGSLLRVKMETKPSHCLPQNILIQLSTNQNIPIINQSKNKCCLKLHMDRKRVNTSRKNMWKFRSFNLTSFICIFSLFLFFPTHVHSYSTRVLSVCGFRQNRHSFIHWSITWQYRRFLFLNQGYFWIFSGSIMFDTSNAKIW